VSDDTPPTEEPAASELEREERRLERLRLVVSAWPTPHSIDDADPDPKAAA